MMKVNRCHECQRLCPRLSQMSQRHQRLCRQLLPSWRVVATAQVDRRRYMRQWHACRQDGLARRGRRLRRSRLWLWPSWMPWCSLYSWPTAQPCLWRAYQREPYQWLRCTKIMRWKMPWSLKASRTSAHPSARTCVPLFAHRFVSSFFRRCVSSYVRPPVRSLVLVRL